MNKKHLAIFGSTGSIGQAALDVLQCLGADWRATALSTHRNIDLLASQVETFRPQYAIITGASPTADQQARLTRTGTKVLQGPEALAQVAADGSSGTVLAAIVGAAGLPSVMAAARAGKRIALANKESLVVAGSLLMPLVKASGAELLPVDSEHSAIFQALLAGKRSEVRKVILTASGGPFRTASLAEIQAATAAQALAHPTWQMGSKITIDSATMFNKAFELIEARWLFDLSPEEIEVVVHPQSIIHSLVEFNDGNVLAQLSPPDMRTPIQYALTHPDRVHCPSRKMDWGARSTLTFEPPDRQKFPALDLAYEVARMGGTSGAVLNAANEVAVEAFLAGGIRFGAITTVVRTVLSAHRLIASPTYEDLLAADVWARSEATKAMPSLQPA